MRQLSVQQDSRRLSRENLFIKAQARLGVLLFLVLNFLDALSTTLSLTHISNSSIQAEEINPLMNFMWQTHPVLFWVFKVILIGGLGAWLLYKHASRPFHLALIIGLDIVFTAVVCWNLFGYFWLINL